MKFQDDDKIDRQQMSVIVETLKERDLIVMLMKELKGIFKKVKASDLVKEQNEVEPLTLRLQIHCGEVR